jgi:predicted CopG family antitoxin
MATKTISIDMDSYQTLAAARLTSKESFSQVIKRATWKKKAKSCGDLLAALPQMPMASEDVLRRLDAAQAADQPPDDPRA